MIRSIHTILWSRSEICLLSALTARLQSHWRDICLNWRYQTKELILSSKCEGSYMVRWTGCQEAEIQIEFPCNAMNISSWHIIRSLTTSAYNHPWIHGYYLNKQIVVTRVCLASSRALVHLPYWACVTVSQYYLENLRKMNVKQMVKFKEILQWVGNAYLPGHVLYEVSLRNTYGVGTPDFRPTCPGGFPFLL